MYTPNNHNNNKGWFAGVANLSPVYCLNVGGQLAGSLR